MNRFYSGSMNDAGLPTTEFLKGVSPHTISEVVAKSQRILGRHEPVLKLGGGARDGMGETGLPGLFENIEVPPLRLGKFTDPFRPADYGAFGPSGLERERAVAQRVLAGFTKLSKFCLGDLVAVAPGEVGKVVRIGPGFLDLKTATGSVRTLTEGVTKVSPMPIGSRMRRIGSDVVCTLLSYVGDEVRVRYASGAEEMIPVSEVVLAAEAMLLPPSIDANHGNRFIPGRPISLQSAPKVDTGFSLLKNTRPFTPKPVGADGGGDPMLDTGL